MFEDSPNGVLGARLAGMQCIFVSDSEQQQELCAGASMVLDSLEDFQPELFGLPPFDDIGTCSGHDGRTERTVARIPNS